MKPKALTAEQVDAVKKFLGLPPYNLLAFTYGDGYYAHSLQQRYGWSDAEFHAACEQVKK
jgi:hypothetical protein